MEFEEITGQVIGSLEGALRYRTGGSRKCLSVYKTCLQHELRKTDIIVQAEVSLPVLYDGLRMDSGFRIDLLVENLLIVELKCVESILPIHKAQLLTYLRLANKPIGLLLNFNVVHLRDGLKRILNNKYH